MNLSEPQYETLLKFDEKILQLQKEVQQLEKDYGFSEDKVNTIITIKGKAGQSLEKTAKFGKKTDTKTLKTKSSLNLGPKENRYKNLPSMKIPDKEIPKKIIKPEIDPNWKDINKIKPNLMTFYDKDVYQKKYVDIKDFSGKPVFLKSQSIL